MSVQEFKEAQATYNPLKQPGLRSLIADRAYDKLGNRIVHPRIYLSAAQEIFAITLVITWTITLIFYPEEITRHPAKHIIGTLNPCFGWDYPPASYIAMMMCSINVYLLWKYHFYIADLVKIVYKDTIPWYEGFIFYSSGFLALSANAWLLLWLLGPQSSGALIPPDQIPHGDLGPAAPRDAPQWIIHTLLFFNYAITQYITAIAQSVAVVYSQQKKLSRPCKTYLLVYSITVLFMVVVYMWDLFTFWKKGSPAVVPTWMVNLANVLWVLCVLFTGSFLPWDTPLKIVTTVLPEGCEEDPESMGLVQDSGCASPSP